MGFLQWFGPTAGERPGRRGQRLAWRGLFKRPAGHAIIASSQLAGRWACAADDGSAIISRLCSIEARFLHHAYRLTAADRYSEMKTFSANADNVKRDWFVVDATDKTLGRLSTEIARRLRGKHKPEYTPHCDTGDYIVVINAQKVAVTGAKLDDKMYHRFTGYVGNLKTTSLKDLLATYPERVIEIAVKGMLPKNPLGREMYRKLKVYGGAEHPHTAQQPQALEI
jgi:large subunit ribosomal protein L13